MGTGAARDAHPSVRPAMATQARGSGETASPKSASTKVVSIAESDNISPLIPPLDAQLTKQFNAGRARRRTGRYASSSSSRASLSSQKSMEELPPSALSGVSQSREDETPRVQNHYRRHHRKYRQLYKKLVAQVAEWLESEKAKKVARKEVHQDSTTIMEDDRATVSGRSRTSSLISHSSVASLERLQRILEDNMAAAGYERLPASSPYLGPRTGSQSTGPRQRVSTRPTHARHASSDTDYLDGDVIVPSCDVMLDNSRTLGYSRGPATPEFNLFAIRKRTEKEHKAWLNFKNQILRLAHTLRLKGWRRISLEDCDEIKVERLSGALTNAVYVISPPKDLPAPKETTGIVSARIPNRLLLRIYGPQVGHLIDREQELGILRRLARKRIGPRLLGSFLNGRFEEYFVSTTLTSADLRVAETSKQIAKRMRELHDGIDLLEQERRNGPFVWRNWDKWVGRCEYVIQYLDQEILSGRTGTARSRTELWKQRGLVCGVEWPVFRAMVEKCREFLLDYYGGSESIKEKLVFAHNDTQYGNILRLNLPGGSPLLHPENTHKQLVVIDFEYASANTPGLEFANHFTEWCYNYHDPVAPYACNEHNYPTIEEQLRFIRSYVSHRPQFSAGDPATPKAVPSAGPGRSISEFLLDSGTPSPGMARNYAEEEALRERQAERVVEELMEETRLWRVANSAQWVAWGIVQAKDPCVDFLPQAGAGRLGLVKSPEQMDGPQYPIGDATSGALDPRHGSHPDKYRQDDNISTLPLDNYAEGRGADGAEDGEDEFDYLAYAQDRARFFWGDCVELGLVREEELPVNLRRSLKRVAY